EGHRSHQPRARDLLLEGPLDPLHHRLGQGELDQRVEQAAVRSARLVHVLEAEELEGGVVLHREPRELGKIVVGGGILAVLQELDAQDHARALVVVDQGGGGTWAEETEQKNRDKERSFHRVTSWLGPRMERTPVDGAGAASTGTISRAGVVTSRISDQLWRSRQTLWCSMPSSFTSRVR